MHVVHTAADLAALPPAAAADGGPGRRAVVMTMGALHEGHLALVRAAREATEQVVVTIFVNPLQFNDKSDLERYPRTLEADAALLEPLGVDAVFAPSVDEVYPGGSPVVTVSAGAINNVFEGVHRPGHFDGVLTVVLKLMHLTQPDLAFFGQKDAQQVIAIRTMVRDLNVPLAVEVVPTVREDDGLALSSRNVFLSEGERRQALALHRALEAAVERAAARGDADEVVGAARSVLASAALEAKRSPRDHSAFVVGYVGAMDPTTAQPVPSDYRGDVVIAVAVRVGETRLIDNVVTRIGGPEEESQ